MKVIIFGGDGFCGWPSALELSSHDHEVTIVDNFVRRRIDNELGVQSLTPIRSLDERRKAWSGLTGRAIDAVDPSPSSGTPYEQWSKAELYERAQELDIDGRSSMSKQQLIKALRAA